jgi:hypothetical protein
VIFSFALPLAVPSEIFGANKAKPKFVVPSRVRPLGRFSESAGLFGVMGISCRRKFWDLSLGLHSPVLGSLKRSSKSVPRLGGKTIACQ